MGCLLSRLRQDSNTEQGNYSGRVISPQGNTREISSSAFMVLPASPQVGNQPPVDRPNPDTTTKPFTSTYVPTRLLVAAIDLGTAYSGYAFSTTAEYKNDPITIHANQVWVSGGRSLLSLKTPTCILLDKENKFISFGYEAENMYADLVLDKNHQEYFYFHRFKMILHNNTKLSVSTTIEDITGKEVRALLVFSLFIKALKDHLMEVLMTRGLELRPEEIQWVLTVPAIWTDKAKQFMRLAATKGGIPGDQLVIALEPEAASMYCQHLPVQRLIGADLDFTVTVTGTKYMVVDIGGGTTDITVHEKLGDGTLRELYKASGGACGGTAIDSKFIQSTIIRVAGAPVYKKLSVEFPSCYLDLYREIETVKRVMKPEKEGKINCTVPIMALNEVCQDVINEKFDDALKNCSTISDRVTIFGDKMRIDAAMMKEDIFDDVLNDIVNCIRLVLNEVRDISIMLLVGGFSESPMVQGVVRETFPDKRIIIPQEAGLAVLNGAVIYGHQPNVISSRISRYTYGVQITAPFDKKRHRQDKKIDVNGEEMCDDVFSIFMQAGKTIPVGHMEHSVYHTVYPHQPYVSLCIYYSESSNPLYTDDEGCEYLGDMVINVGNPSSRLRAFDVQYHFGATEITVTAVERQSQMPCTAEFKLL